MALTSHCSQRSGKLPYLSGLESALKLPQPYICLHLSCASFILTSAGDCYERPRKIVNWYRNISRCTKVDFVLQAGNQAAKAWCLIRTKREA